MNDRHPGTDGPVADLLLRSGRFFARSEVSRDLRTISKSGGRQGDVFYRDRWSHDKVVRSTHGVNCTGSCSWKVYVKDGIITWETQETDYPTVGPDRPDYEPRGCPRGAAFSWYTYSPTRVRYPYARGVLVEMFREARGTARRPGAGVGGDPGDPERRRRYQRARGKGGLVRIGWDEVAEIAAAAHVHTISPVRPRSHRRLLADPGDVDGVARGRVAVHRTARRRDDLVLRLVRRPAGGLPAGLRRPDRRAGIRRLVGRLVPDDVGLQRPGHPDPGRALDGRGPLPRNEGRVGQPRLLGQHQVRRRVDAVRARHRRGHGDGDGSRHPVGVPGRQRTPFFVDYVQQYTDLPFLVRLDDRDGAYVPGKNLTAADLGDTGEGAAFKPALLDGRTGEVVVPNGSLGFRYTESGVGKWNLDLGEIIPQLTVLGGPAGSVTVKLARFDTPDGHAEVLTRGVPVRRIGDHLCCTVFDLMLAQYGVAREGLPGDWPSGYDDDTNPYTPAWQEPITGVSASQVIRIAREFAHNAEESGGRSMIIMGAGICQWFHGDATYRAVLAMLILTGSMGRNGGGWAHYVGQEKCRPITGWATMAMASDWVRPPRQMIGTGYWYAHTDQWRYDGYRADVLDLPARPGPVRRHAHDGRAGVVGGDGLDAVLPAVRPQQPGRRRRGG